MCGATHDEERENALFLRQRCVRNLSASDEFTAATYRRLQLCMPTYHMIKVRMPQALYSKYSCHACMHARCVLRYPPIPSPVECYRG